MILDTTSGPRMMWFNKEHPNTIFLDKKKSCKPNIVADFCHLPFKANIFDLVVFDPPHTSAGTAGIFYKKFGTLRASKFVSLIYRASREILRVLKNKAIMIFKWNDHNYPLKRTLALFPTAPLFAQKTAYKTSSGSSTYWVTFQKNAKDNT